MSDLRKMLLDIQKEKTLKLLLKEDYDTVSEEKKQHYLSIVDKQIEADVDRMLHEYITNYELNTPVAKKSYKLRWVYILANVILVPGIAYSVNKEEWIFLVIMSILMVVNQALPFIYEKE